MNKRLSLLALIFCLTASTLYSQRRGTTYQALSMRADHPSAYFDHVSFPASDSTAQFAFLFRLDYDFIPFLKKDADMDAPSPESEYYGPVQVGLDIFAGPASRSRRSSGTSNSIYRDSWQDTLWVNTYEETTSRTDYTQGIIHTDLESGEYHYEVQLPRSDMPVPGDRTSNNRRRERPTPRKNANLTGYGGAEKADFILLQNFRNDGNTFSATFLNYGNNVMYGEDYSVLVRIPGSDTGSGILELNLYRITGGAGSDSEELRYSQEISSDQTFQLNNVNFTSSEDGVGFEADISSNGATYVSIEIPNKNFENSNYKFTLANRDSDDVLGEKMIRSQWLDMPVSLYNLDVAIDMLRFIIDDSERKRINSGSDSEREKKFREFWAERDPTPNTEFNELMTEYYNRIDYAYNEFSSLQIPGYETDQGKTYILYGPPDEVERQLPTDAPTREIWHYPNRTLIFEATTGFGDFELVSEEKS